MQQRAGGAEVAVAVAANALNISANNSITPINEPLLKPIGYNDHAWFITA